MHARAMHIVLAAANADDGRRCDFGCAGSDVVLHHELTVPVGRLHRSGKLKVHVPVRKIVRCRTHDLQQSLMCKLGRATQNFQATEGALLVRSLGEESPFEVVGAPTFDGPPFCSEMLWSLSHTGRAVVHLPGLQ